MRCKNASHFKLSFQWQVLGFQQLLWNPFNWSSMKIWGVQLKFTSQTHPDFIKDLIFLYLPIKYIYKCVWVCINQYLLDNCCFELFGFLFLFFPLEELFFFFFMKNELCSPHAMGVGMNNLWEILPTPSAPGWDLEHTIPLLLPSPVLYSALPSSPSSFCGLGKDRGESGWFPWWLMQWEHRGQHWACLGQAEDIAILFPCHYFLFLSSKT